MDKTMKWLAGLLAAQLVLTVWAFSGGSDLDRRPAGDPLLSFDAKAVDSILVEGPEGESVRLSRTGDGWLLPDHWQAPAAQGKVEQLLRRLGHLKAGLAVAASADARARFEVAEDKFQRRIRLGVGGKDLDPLYLGTSPAMRKIHARAAGEAVYAVDFSAYEAPLEADDWIDPALLQADANGLKAVEFGGLRLSREADQDWRASGLGTDEQLNPVKAKTLAEKLAGLSVRKVLGTENKSEYGQNTPALSLSLDKGTEAPVLWTWSKPDKGEDYVLKSSAHPWYVEVAAWSAEPVLELAKRGALVVTAAGAAGEAGEKAAIPE